MVPAVGSWREVAAQVAQRAPVEEPPSETYGLPAPLVASLRMLDTLPPPRRIERPECWRAVVNDALRIAREGWAAKAMRLGWTEHDLFGVGPVDDREFAGLAVWLVGRPLVSITLDRAMARGGDAFCSVFVRGGPGHGTQPTIAPVLLWEFGR